MPDSTVTRRFGGTGLGLTIVQRIAEALGGSVSVTSAVGQGSCFVLKVAMGKSQGRASGRENDQALQSAKPTPAPSGLEDRRVLLVEDGLDNQRLISYILTKAGVHVEIAENGRSGAAKAMEASLAGRPFEIILMDMQMPVMDGYEATRYLRKLGYRRPIIAVTAHALVGDREKCLEAGCDDYATKPINREGLLAQIRACLHDVDRVDATTASGATDPQDGRIGLADEHLLRAVFGGGGLRPRTGRGAQRQDQNEGQC
jgi:CheY-like chemotaxis protein